MMVARVSRAKTVLVRVFSTTTNLHLLGQVRRSICVFLEKCK